MTEPSTPALRRRLFLLSLLGAAAACREEGAAELPNLGHVPEFALTDQEGRPFTRETLAGKIWVAAFMFTRCPTICPRITRRMRELQERAASAKVSLRLVSFSVDPEHDTPKVLREYAKQYDADLASWSFLTGDSAVIGATAVQGFKLALEGRANPAKPDFGILHGSHLVLVDRSADLRGFYRTDDAAEVRRLVSDAARLS
jgi:protein SCO1/2